MVKAQRSLDWEGDIHHNMWDQFREEFKKFFFPNNVMYEVKYKFWESKKTGNIWVNVEEFITLTLQIPNLTNE